jgi:hypothetical protein
MFARPAPGLALLPFAAACLLAAACSNDVSGPGDPAARPSDVRLAESTSTCSSDSIQAGYGCCSTGGIEYTEFEYDPATGTEYVATCDTTGTAPTTQPTPTTSTPLPPPPTSPTPTSPTPTR